MLVMVTAMMAFNDRLAVAIPAGSKSLMLPKWVIASPMPAATRKHPAATTVGRWPVQMLILGSWAMPVFRTKAWAS
jgi:hypothetical protein